MSSSYNAAKPTYISKLILKYKLTALEDEVSLTGSECQKLPIARDNCQLTQRLCIFLILIIFGEIPQKGKAHRLWNSCLGDGGAVYFAWSFRGPF